MEMSVSATFCKWKPIRVQTERNGVLSGGIDLFVLSMESMLRGSFTVHGGEAILFSSVLRCAFHKDDAGYFHEIHQGEGGGARQRCSGYPAGFGGE